MPSSPPVSPTSRKSQEDDAFYTSKLENQQEYNKQNHRDSGTIVGLLVGMFNKLKVNTEEDWEFWGNVLENPTKYSNNDIIKRVRCGIPEKLRGIVWQFLLQSKDPQLESRYVNYLKQTSPFSKQIQLDLNRTFPNNPLFDSLTQNSLYNVLNSLALHDSQLGYCQGLPFIVGPMLLHVPEEETFCLLVSLLRLNNMREMYTPGMSGLLLRLFQFEKLVAERIPTLDSYFQDQGIRASMYATSWFMTMFATHANLELVNRVFDVVFCEGFESIFKFALCLLIQNANDIIGLDFDQALEFLKRDIFKVYSDNPTQWAMDASKIYLDKSMLDTLALEYASQQRKNDFSFIELDQLRSQVLRTTRELKRLQKDYEQLVQEHVTSTKELVEVRIEAERMRDHSETLEKQVEYLQSILIQEEDLAHKKVQDQFQSLVQKNVILTELVTELEDRLEETEERLVKVKLLHAESEGERFELMKKLQDSL